MKTLRVSCIPDGLSHYCIGGIVQKLDFGPKTKIAVTNEGNLAFQKFRTIGNKNLWKIGEPLRVNLRILM
jgi:hypothetical protein